MAGSSSTARVVDFSNVKEGGNFNKRRVPEGDYLAVITKVEDAETKKTKEFQYLFSIKLKNKHTDRVFPYYCQLTEASLWKLRNLAIAAGLNVPKKRMKFDPSKVLNKTIGITLADAEYEGKEQSEIVAVFPSVELVEGNIVAEDEDEDTPEDDETEEVEDDTEDEEETEEEVEDDEEEADPYADLDRAALKAALKERDPSFQAKKSQTDDDLRDLLRAGDSTEEVEEDDDDDEPELEPVVVKKAAKKSAKGKKKATVTDEELEELDIDDL